MTFDIHIVHTIYVKTRVTVEKYDLLPIKIEKHGLDITIKFL